jgi:hypothetical protein
LFSGLIAATGAFYRVSRIVAPSRGVDRQLRECRRVQLEQPLVWCPPNTNAIPTAHQTDAQELAGVSYAVQGQSDMIAAFSVPCHR